MHLWERISYWRFQLWTICTNNPYPYHMSHVGSREGRRRWPWCPWVGCRRKSSGKTPVVEGPEAKQRGASRAQRLSRSTDPSPGARWQELPYRARSIFWAGVDLSWWCRSWSGEKALLGLSSASSGLLSGCPPAVPSSRAPLWGFCRVVPPGFLRVVLPGRIAKGSLRGEGWEGRPSRVWPASVPVRARPHQPLNPPSTTL